MVVGHRMAAVAGLARNHLDVRRMPWRLHVYSQVRISTSQTPVSACIRG